MIGCVCKVYLLVLPFFVSEPVLCTLGRALATMGGGESKLKFVSKSIVYSLVYS